MAWLAVGTAAAQEGPARGGGTAAPTPAESEQPEIKPAPAAGQDAPAAEEAPADTKDATAEDKDVPPSKGRGLGGLLMPAVMIGGLVLLFVFMGRKPRQQEKKRQEMLANLKKGDKVTSIGGIIGSVMEVRENEITVKVDETSNTRVKFLRSAIRGIGAPDDEAKTT
jgi:preprotein translocase subunit YajC